MSVPMQKSKLEWIAAIVSATIVVVSIVYWIVQIEGVREMLKKAYP